MFIMDTRMLHSRTHTHTQTYIHSHTLLRVKAWVPVERDQPWQAAVSCRAERNDSQDNGSRAWKGLLLCCDGLERQVASKPWWWCVCVALPSLSPRPWAFGKTHFHSSIFIYASSSAECSGILVPSEPEREVQLHFSCYTWVLSIWHFICRRLRPQDKAAHCVISEGR